MMMLMMIWKKINTFLLALIDQCSVCSSIHTLTRERTCQSRWLSQVPINLHISHEYAPCRCSSSVPAINVRDGTKTETYLSSIQNRFLSSPVSETRSSRRERKMINWSSESLFRLCMGCEICETGWASASGKRKGYFLRTMRENLISDFHRSFPHSRDMIVTSY